MDKKDEFIQVPTLSFPAYTEPKRPRWLLFLGAVVLLAGLGLLIVALMSFMG